SDTVTSATPSKCDDIWGPNWPRYMFRLVRRACNRCGARALIEGVVAANRKGVVSLVVGPFTGKPEAVDLVVDTGFSGWLALPIQKIRRLRLQHVGSRNIGLASGETKPADVYLGRVFWDGADAVVEILATHGPSLVGVSMFYGYRLTF